MGAADPQSAEGYLPKKVGAGTTWLWRFGDKNWRDRLRQWAQDYKFHATLPAKLDQAEAEWHAAQPAEPEPVIVHHAIDDELQTGDSRLLGGAMSIHAPWTDDAKQDPPA